MKVSVIVPVYNAEKFLDESLSDITGQTLADIEIICVDDGSTDNSREIIRRWMEKDKRIILLEQKNQYAGAARNNGLAHASGKYVICWDADDLFDKEALEKLYNQAEKENTDICFCAAQKYDNDTGKYHSSDAFLRADLLPGDKEVFNKYDIPDFIFTVTANVPWNKLYRRVFVEEHRLEYQVIRQAEDTYFTMKAMFLAERISYIKDVLVSYRVNNNSSLTGRASDTLFCAYDSYMYTLKDLEQYPDFELVKNAFRSRAMRGFCHSLDSQTTFSAYEQVYNRVKEEGIQVLGLDKCRPEVFDKLWIYNDLQKIQSMSAQDFLVQKSMIRRIENEYHKADRKKERKEFRELKKENLRLRKQADEFRGKLDKILNSRSYRLMKKMMWLPWKIENAVGKGQGGN